MAIRCSLRIVVLATCATLFALAQPNAYLAPLPSGETLVDVQQTPSGNWLVASHGLRASTPEQDETTDVGQQVFLRLVSRDGDVLATKEIGGVGRDSVSAVALQSDGRVVVIGGTNSIDFPVVNPLFPLGGTNHPVVSGDFHRTQGFLVQLSPDLSTTLQATLLGGVSNDLQSYSETLLSALAVDAGDRIYVGGRTGRTDFPVSPTLSLRGTTSLSRNSFDLVQEGFILRFDAKIEHLEFSTFIGATKPTCQGGSGCIFQYTSDVERLAVDANGVVTALVRGSAYTASSGGLDLSDRYAIHGIALREAKKQVLRIDTENASLLWVADLGYTNFVIPIDGRVSRPMLSVDNAGRSIVTLLSDWKADAKTSERPITLDVLTISADGSTLIQRDALGLDATMGLDGAALESDGAIWLAGPTNSSDWFTMEPEAQSGSQYLIRFNLSTRKIDRALLLPNGNADRNLTFDAEGRLWTAGGTGAIQSIPQSTALEHAILGIANSASYETSGRLSPGELISIYGVGFGPSTGHGATFDSEHKLPFTLGNASVRINGAPAPLLYTSDTQINFIAPFALADAGDTGGRPKLEIVYRDQVVLSAVLQKSVAQPHAFTTVGFLYQDEKHPAAFPILQIHGQDPLDTDLPVQTGDAVTLWMNGAGEWKGTVTDGKQQTAPYNEPTLMLRAVISASELVGQGTPLAVEYFGAAPGFAAGLLQVNVRIPEDMPMTGGEYRFLYLQLGEVSANGFRVVAEAPAYRIRVASRLP